MVNGHEETHQNQQFLFEQLWQETGKPWLNALSEGVMPLFSVEEFISNISSNLNESNDNKSVVNLYAIYETSLLRTHRSDWFLNEGEILAIPNHEQEKMILFKNESVFIVSMNTWNIINEGFMGDAWDAAKKAAGKAWDGLTDAVKDAAAFVQKITSYAIDYTKKNPHEVAATIVTILSGVSSFIPGVGQIIAPLLAVLAGGIEVHAGYGKISKGIKYLKNVDNPIAKTIASCKDGIPYLMAGGVTLLLGSYGMATGIKATIPGAGAVQLATKKAATASADALGKTVVVKLEHSVVHAVEGLLKKVGKKALSNLHELSSAAAALLMILLVKIGKGCLGGIFDVMVKALSGIGDVFNFLLDIPKKISDAINKMNGDTFVTKMIVDALKKIVKPISEGLGQFISKNIRPIVDPVLSYLKALPENYKTCVEQLDKHAKDLDAKEVAVKDIKIKDRSGLKVSDKTKKTLNKIEKEGMNESSSILSFNKWMDKNI